MNTEIKEKPHAEYYGSRIPNGPWYAPPSTDDSDDALNTTNSLSLAILEEAGRNDYSIS